MDALKQLKEISSDYSVLYVEDDREIAKTLIHYLSKLFKEVVYAQNGEEGLELYKQYQYDIIITDIMMPKMNGLEMSHEIKKIHPAQNIIVVSAYAEIENFIESIKIGIDGYIIKPINYVDMNNTLLKTVTKIKIFKENSDYEKKLEEILKQLKIDNNRLKQFTEVIDKVAIVSKTDLKGIITYVNDFFVEISGYTKEELLGFTHNIIRHPDMPKSVYTELWETIQEGKAWEGTIKNKKKDGKPYYVHAVILPLKDSKDEIAEYMGIRFLTTDEEVEKREFKKKVMTNYMEFKKTNMNAIEMISDLSKELDQIKHEYESNKLQLDKINKKYQKASRQIDFYEKGQKEKDTQYYKILEIQKSNLQKIGDSHKKSLAIIEKQKKEMDILREENKIKAKEVVKLNDEVNEQTNIILDLRDTIKNIAQDSKRN